MRRLTLLACAVLALGVTACGGDDELTSQTPKTIPDLTIPTTADEGGASTTSTDADDDAPATSGATGGTASGTPSTAAPSTAAPATPAPTDGTSGGTSSGGTADAPAATPETGGAEAGAGGNADFCANNPGAC